MTSHRTPTIIAPSALVNTARAGLQMISSHSAWLIRSGIVAARHREFPFSHTLDHTLQPTHVPLYMKAWHRTNAKLTHPRCTTFCADKNIYVPESGYSL